MWSVVAAVFVVLATLYHFISVRTIIFSLLKAWHKFNIWVMWCKGTTPEVGQQLFPLELLAQLALTG